MNVEIGLKIFVKFIIGLDITCLDRLNIFIIFEDNNFIHVKIAW